MKKKTVLFVDHDPLRSGATVSMEYLLRAFIRGGYDVYVFSPKTGAEAKQLSLCGATVLGYRSRWLNTLALDLHFTYTVPTISAKGLITSAKNIVKFFLGVFMVLGAIRRTGATLVYVNEYVVVQGSVAAFLSRVPSVIHLRSLFLQGTLGLRRRMLTWLILAFNRKIFAISLREAEQLHAKGLLRTKVEVMGEFCDSTDQPTGNREERRRELDVEGEALLVTMLGGISPIKGSLDFLRAAERMSTIRPNVVFALAGKQERTSEPMGTGKGYAAQCAQVIERLRPARTVRILDVVADAVGLIRASDIIVAPSTVTHFSRPVIEAWAAAKPVVATAIDHMRDLIDDGHNGILVPVGDHSALVEALLSLIADKSLRRRLGDEGRKKAKELFDAERNTSAIRAACGALLETGRKKGAT